MAVSRWDRKRLLVGLAFVSPWLVGFAWFMAYPILSSLHLSFCDFSVLRPPRWVGLANYREAFSEDEYFWTAVGNTLYMFAELPLAMVLGVTAAVLLNRAWRSIPFFRALYYLPYMLPTVTVALMWLWILNPRFGLLNGILASLGIEGPGWLSSKEWSKPAFILMDLWGVGGGAVIYLAALQGVPQELYESAQLDGAGPVARFRHVTVPMLSPTVFFMLVTGVIGIFQYFTQTYVTTRGGPENSTLFYGLYVYMNAFEHFRMGYACALAWLLFVVALIATWLIFRTSVRWVYYEAEAA